jgi:hypothetical protein
MRRSGSDRVSVTCRLSSPPSQVEDTIIDVTSFEVSLFQVVNESHPMNNPTSHDPQTADG